MAKIIHTADIHLDSPLRGLVAYEGAPAEQCRLASREALSRLVDEAIKLSTDVVLIAGDLYDGDWTDMHTGLFFTKEMVRLQKENIQVFIIRGNHDAKSRMTKHLHLPENVTVFGEKTPSSVVLSDLELAIHGQSYETPVVLENLVKGYPDPVEGVCNFGLLHTSLDGREGHAPYAPCSKEDLRAKGYDYWALGHVHGREEVCCDPWIVYPGILQGRHIRETGEKGFYFVETKGPEVTKVQFHPLSIFRWELLFFDLSHLQDEEEVLPFLREKMTTQLQEKSQGEELWACRVTLQGEGTLYDRMIADKLKWENEIRALALEFMNPHLWIEKVLFKTSSKKQAPISEGALGEVHNVFYELSKLSDDDGVWQDIVEECGVLQRQVGGVLDRESWDSEDPQFLRERMEKVEEFLLARLRGE